MYQQIVRLVGDIRALAVQNRMWASDHYEGDRGLERGEYVKIVKRNVKNRTQEAESVVAQKLSVDAVGLGRYTIRSIPKLKLMLQSGTR